ncbi:TSUP family transporter [Leptolyngbya sp. 15MV]|nr:TSUP family transporter [Leptolyngbya sp. 15MV]
MNIARAIRPRPERVFGQDQRPGTGTLVGIGSTAGVMGGVLGVGGGVVMVPMLQLLGKVPLRLAIGASSASMILSALVGAALKFGTLGHHGQSASLAGLYALVMAPTAVLGADLGARLTHALPLRLVRVILSVLLLAAAWRLAEVGTLVRGLMGL